MNVTALAPATMEKTALSVSEVILMRPALMFSFITVLLGTLIYSVIPQDIRWKGVSWPANERLSFCCFYIRRCNIAWLTELGLLVQTQIFGKIGGTGSTARKRPARSEPLLLIASLKRLLILPVCFPSTRNPHTLQSLIQCDVFGRRLCSCVTLSRQHNN